MANTLKYLNHLVQRAGITPACSEEEREAAELIADVYRNHGFNPEIQEFNAPTFTRLPHVIIGILLFLGSILYGIGGAAGIVGFVMIVASTALYFLDRFGRLEGFLRGGTGLSQNVIAYHKASGPLASPRNRPVVIVAHYDSPRADMFSRPELAPYRPLMMKLMPFACAAPVVLAILSLLPIPGFLRTVFWILSLVCAALPLFNAVCIIMNKFFLPYTSGSVCNKSSVAAMLGVMDAVSPFHGENEFPDDIPAERFASTYRYSDEAGEEPSEEGVYRADETFSAVSGFGEEGPAAEPVAPVAGASQPAQVAAATVPAAPAESAARRHGIEVLRALQMLPDTCEIEYEAPRVEPAPAPVPEPVQAAEAAAPTVPEGVAPAAAPVAPVTPGDPEPSVAQIDTQDTVQLSRAELAAAASAAVAEGAEPEQAMEPAAQAAEEASPVERPHYVDDSDALLEAAAQPGFDDEEPAEEGIDYAAAVEQLPPAEDAVMAVNAAITAAKHVALSDHYVMADTPAPRPIEPAPAPEPEVVEQPAAQASEPVAYEQEQVDLEATTAWEAQPAYEEPYAPAYDEVAEDEIVAEQEQREEPAADAYAGGPAYDLVSDTEEYLEEDAYRQQDDAYAEEAEEGYEEQQVEEQLAATDFFGSLRDRVQGGVQSLTEQAQSIPERVRGLSFVQRIQEALQSRGAADDAADEHYESEAEDAPEAQEEYEAAPVDKTAAWDPSMTYDSTAAYESVSDDALDSTAPYEPETEVYEETYEEAAASAPQYREYAGGAYGYEEEPAAYAEPEPEAPHAEDSFENEETWSPVYHEASYDEPVEEHASDDVPQAVTEEPESVAAPEPVAHAAEPAYTEETAQAAEELQVFSVKDLIPDTPQVDPDATQAFSAVQAREAREAAVDVMMQQIDLASSQPLPEPETVQAEPESASEPVAEASQDAKDVVDDPEWGTSSFEPIEVPSTANRSALFDLPDPAASSDPFTTGVSDKGTIDADMAPYQEPQKPVVPPFIAEAVKQKPTPRRASHADADESAPANSGASEKPTGKTEKPVKKHGFGKFFGHDEKPEEPEGGSMSEWLGVDDDFDAKTSGRKIGSWDNFENDEKRWKGGAASVESVTDEEMLDAITSMGDDELLGHDIWFVATGSSVHDGAGMKAFLAAHRNKLRGVFLINLECVGAGETAVVMHEGTRKPLKGDRRILGLLNQVSADFHRPFSTVDMPFVETDATVAMGMSLRSITVAGVDPVGPRFACGYSEEDAPENIEPEKIDVVADVVTEVIRRS